MDQNAEIPKSLPYLEHWRQKNSQLLEQIMQRRVKYFFSELPQPTDRGNMGKEYHLNSSGENWQILVTPSINPQNPNPPPAVLPFFEVQQNLQALTEEISQEKKSAYQKRQILDFFAANWDKLWQIFYTSTEDSKDSKRPPCFTEVKISDNESVDFIGITPDGKVLIINFGTPKDVIKDSDYYYQLIVQNPQFQNLEKPLRLKPESLKENIAVYDGLFSFRSEGNTIILTPPKS